MDTNLMILTFLLLILLSFANGANDISKSIATLAGAGVASIPKAIRWGVVWTILGALSGMFWGGAIIKNLSQSFYASHTEMDINVALAVAIAPIIWVLFSTYAKLPVSTTHSLVGAFIGTGLFAYGSDGILWQAVGFKIVLPLLVSPFAAIFLAIVGFNYISKLTDKLPQNQFNILGFKFKLNEDGLHWLTSGILSFARGLNDTPKLIAVMLPIIMLPPAQLGNHYYVVAAFSMGAGAWLIGSRITKILATKVTKMDHHQGFAANLISSFLVIGASRFGLPVSTTHVSTSAIIGVGIAGKSKLDLKVIMSMLGAWLITVPGAGLIAGACYYLICLL
ncbi:MAG: inorganic phosphate transporter [Rhizobiales bacterium]|nr:inorganic phosphate transporter [Hyphomicrobiales bacterium]